MPNDDLVVLDDTGKPTLEARIILLFSIINNGWTKDFQPVEATIARLLDTDPIETIRALHRVQELFRTNSERIKKDAS